MKYKVKSKVETITTNTILQSEDFGGWQAVNVGDTIANVNGITLEPDGKIIGLDYTTLQPNVIWDEPIRIVFLEGSGSHPMVVVTRLKYIEK